MNHLLVFLSSWGISVTWFIYNGNDIFLSFMMGCAVSYLPLYLNQAERKDGMIWPYFQKLSIWKHLVSWNSGSVNVEKTLDHKQQYIFCSFPHGACRSLMAMHTVMLCVLSFIN